MPIYEYRCEQGHTFEVVQRMTDDTLTSCSTCSAPVQRVFHPVAVHFKGSGFYSTDYGKKGAAGGAEAGSKSDSKSESKSESKSGPGSGGEGGSGKDSGSSAKPSSSSSSSSD